MNTRKQHKFKTRIQKANYAILATTTLLCSCGQLSSGEENISPTKITAATSTPDTPPTMTPTVRPEPSPTMTPAPTPEPEVTATSTPSPTPNLVSPAEPTPSWIFLQNHENKKEVSEFLSDEELASATSLAYDPYACPQLFARYHGEMNTYVYIIDFIQLNTRQNNTILRLRFYGSPYRMDRPELLQEMCILIPHTDLESVHNGLEILDLNGDSRDDFRIELGLDVKNVMSLYFAYDKEKEEYAYLGEFAYTTFYPEEQILYENSYATMYNSANKYRIEGTEAVLIESINESGSPCVYTYKKRMDGELITVIETTSYKDFLKEVDPSEWPNMDWWDYEP